MGDIVDKYDPSRIRVTPTRKILRWPDHYSYSQVNAGIQTFSSLLLYQQLFSRQNQQYQLFNNKRLQIMPGEFTRRSTHRCHLSLVQFVLWSVETARKWQKISFLREYCATRCWRSRGKDLGVLQCEPRELQLPLGSCVRTQTHRPPLGYIRLLNKKLCYRKEATRCFVSVSS